MYSSTNTIYGVSSMWGLREDSSICNIQYVKITTSIFSRLEQMNTWHVAVSENLALKCGNDYTFNIIINGTGRIR